MIFRSNRMRPFLTLLGILLAGCTQVNDLNGALIDAYSEKLRLGNPPHSNEELVQAVALQSQFESLIDPAYRAAKSASNANAAISYYRIAATAAWQVLDPRTGEIADEGSRYCDQNNGYAIAPRDCGMLAVIPQLASTDATTTNLKSLIDSGNATLADYQRAFDNLVYAYTVVGRTRAALSGTDASKAFFRLLDKRQSEIASNIDFVVRRAARPARIAGDTTMIPIMCGQVEALQPPVGQPPPCTL